MYVDYSSFNIFLRVQFETSQQIKSVYINILFNNQYLLHNLEPSFRVGHKKNLKKLILTSSLNIYFPFIFLLPRIISDLIN